MDRWGGVFFEGDAPTEICYESAEGRDGAEEDWEQLRLFKMLIDTCGQCTDPQRAYSSIRSTVITSPTATRLDIEDAFGLRGADLRKAAGLIPHLYGDVPQAMEIHGKGVPICAVSGALLIRTGVQQQSVTLGIPRPKCPSTSHDWQVSLCSLGTRTPSRKTARSHEVGLSRDR